MQIHFNLTYLLYLHLSIKEEDVRSVLQVIMATLRWWVGGATCVSVTVTSTCTTRGPATLAQVSASNACSTQRARGANAAGVVTTEMPELRAVRVSRFLIHFPKKKIKKC